MAGIKSMLAQIAHGAVKEFFLAAVGPFCPQPAVPANSYYTRQDWRGSPPGQGATIRCRAGYGINGNPNTLEVNLVCQGPGGALQWSPAPITVACARK